MRQITLFFVCAILLFSCPLLTPEPVDMDMVNTAAYNTALAMISNEQTMTASVPTATFTPTYSPTPTPFPTSTQSFTPSPFPTEIAALLQSKCEIEMPWHKVTGVYRIRLPIEKYEGKGCRLPLFSPNRKYLAYAMPDKQENQDLYVESIKVLETVTGRVQNVHFAHEMSYIDNLEWSPTGQLIIQEQTWEGPLFILIYDPASDSIVTTMRLDPESELRWNAADTALYAKHSHDYGASTCIHELRGYDFAYGNAFPDFYEIFNLKKAESDPLGITNGKNDDLAIEPFTWSGDGRYLWITITLLRKVDDGYEVGPKQAGMLELRQNEVMFTMLASDPHLDYSFDESPDATLVASPYQPHHCP